KNDRLPTLGHHDLLTLLGAREIVCETVLQLPDTDGAHVALVATNPAAVTSDVFRWPATPATGRGATERGSRLPGGPGEGAASRPPSPPARDSAPPRRSRPIACRPPRWRRSSGGTRSGRCRDRPARRRPASGRRRREACARAPRWTGDPTRWRASRARSW